MMSIDTISQRFGAEFGFIILVLRIYFKTADEKLLPAYVAKNKIDWVHLQDLIYMHELRPIMYKVLSNNPKTVNQEFITQLKEDCLQIITGNFEKLQRLLYLQKLFNAHNLNVVPMKGILLSQLLFNDYSLRETCDIDFLILPEDSITVTRLLLEEGYQTDFYFQEDKEYFIRKVSSERAFYKKDSLATGTVEIHWLVVPPSFDINVPTEMLIKNATTKTIFGTAMKQLIKEDLLSSIISHHGVTDVWRSLKHVVDIAAYLRVFATNINWEPYEKSLQKSRIRKTARVGFMMAHELIGIDLPPIRYSKKNQNLYGNILKTLLTYPMLNRLKYSKKHFLQHVALRDSLSDKGRFLIKCSKLIFIPTAADLKVKNYPRRFFFIYYFLKPLRLIKDYFLPGSKQ